MVLAITMRRGISELVGLLLRFYINDLLNLIDSEANSSIESASSALRIGIPMLGMDYVA